MLLDNLLRNIKTQTGLVRGGGTAASRQSFCLRINAPAAAEISLKNMRQIVVRYSIACIAYSKQQFPFRDVVIIVRRNTLHEGLLKTSNTGNRNLLSQRRVADGVVDKIGHYLLNPVRVCNQYRIRSNI